MLNSAFWEAVPVCSSLLGTGNASDVCGMGRAKSFSAVQAAGEFG